MWWILLAAFFGAICHGLGAWADSHQAFDARCFVKTFVTAVVAAAGFGVGYALSESAVGAKDLVLAFLGGVTANAARDYAKGALSPWRYNR